MAEQGEKTGQAEGTEAKGKKGKGKLIIVGALCLALAGGGYFGMAASKKGPEKPKGPELGDMVELTPEFIVNLRERDIFLRASISFQLDKNSDVHLGADGGGHGGASAPSPEMTALRDAITERLSSLSVNDLRKGDFYARLRRVLADDANRVLGLLSHDKPDKEGKAEKDHEEGKSEKEEVAEHHKGKADLTTVTVDPSKLEHPDWDSESGPILKVYITSFATQHE